MSLSSNLVNDIKLLVHDEIIHLTAEMRKIDNTLQHDEIFPIAFAKTITEVANKLLTDSLSYEHVLNHELQSISSSPACAALKGNKEPEKHFDKKGQRKPHNPKEDLEILRFANDCATDGFGEEDLLIHLNNQLNDFKLSTVRNKLSRFSRSPKLFLGKPGIKRYRITENGITELSILRKRLGISD